MNEIKNYICIGIEYFYDSIDDDEIDQRHVIRHIFNILAASKEDAEEKFKKNIEEIYNYDYFDKIIIKEFDPKMDQCLYVIYAE